jgi:hypothetical protein
MKQILLPILLVFGMVTAAAQTTTPMPSQNPKSTRQRATTSPTPSPHNKQMDKKGSTGTYTTGAEAPSTLPNDTTITDKKRGVKRVDPEHPTKPQN